MANKKAQYDFANYIGMSALPQASDILDKQAGVATYINYDLARTCTMFKWEGLPDTIPARQLETILQWYGHATIARIPLNAPGDDLFVFFASLGGEPTIYYMPSLAIIANPALTSSYEFPIYYKELNNADGACVVGRNDDRYMGLLPLLSRYATQLVENDITIRSININARAAGALAADDDATAESARQFLKDLEKGKSGVIGETAFLNGIKSVQYGSDTNDLTNLIELQQYLKGCKNNDLGIQSNYNMKREILTTSENEMNSSAIQPLADNMLKCRQIFAEELNTVFGLNIRVDFDGVWAAQEAANATLAVQKGAAANATLAVQKGALNAPALNAPAAKTAKEEWGGETLDGENSPEIPHEAGDENAKK